MQRALFPMRNMKITQGYSTGTHRDSYAIDNAGKDGSVENVFAPFDCVVKKIYTADANEVWIESKDPVQYADGTEDYMTILLAHDNDVSNLKVGQEIKQGAVFYQEGTKGQATGNHIHMECGKGKFEGTGWFQNAAGYWGILNAKKPQECLWVGTDVNVMNDGGYKWRKTNTPDKPENKQTVDEIAQEVIQGEWGNGAERKSRFTAAGYDYETVQEKVNKIMNAQANTSKKTVDEIAQEVIRGEWGNGAERKSKLTAAGYDYEKVQARVNELI